MKVFCYWNLHKKLWSVKAVEGELKGIVIAHCRELTMNDCILKVSEAGRQRVLQEKKKNVHAGIVGTIQFEYVDPKEENIRLRYNPYKGPDFVGVDHVGREIGKRTRESRISLDRNGKAWSV